MHSGFLGSPFTIASAALSDTNVTDIARIFNETNITTTSNLTFEPTRLLFVNYPEAIIHKPFLSEGWPQPQTAGTNATNGTIASNDTIAGLNITEALQVSVNMTVTRPLILEQPLFAVDGSIDDNLNETYVVAIVDFGNTTVSVPPVVHYIGANYTANTTMGRLSVLSNSTPALLEYTPVDFIFGPDPNRFAFLLFQQNDTFNATGLNFTDPLVNSNFSISEFMNSTGLSDPIGGTMFWVAPCGDISNMTDSSLASFTWSMSWGFNASATYQWGASGFSTSSSGFSSGFSNGGNGSPSGGPGSCSCGPWNGGMMPIGTPSSFSPQGTGLSGTSPADGTSPTNTSSIDSSSPSDASPTDGSVPTDSSSLNGTSPTDTSLGSFPTDGSSPTDGTTDGISPTAGTSPTDGSFPTDGTSPTDSFTADGIFPSGTSPTDGLSPTDTTDAMSSVPTGGSLPTDSPLNNPSDTNMIPNQSSGANPLSTVTGSSVPSGLTPNQTPDGPNDSTGTAPDGSPTASSPGGFNDPNSSDLLPSGTDTGLTGTSTSSSPDNNDDDDDGGSCPLNNGGSSKQNVATATATSTTVVAPAVASLSPRWAKSARNLHRRNLHKNI